jgi:hypothetical protein
MPRILQLSPDEIIEQLRISGASEAEIEATRRAQAKAEERGRIVDAEVERLRDKWLAYDVLSGWQLRGYGPDGGVVDHPRTGRRVILSVQREDDGEVWLHASISRRDRSLPTYEDLKTLHRVFMSGLVAYQLFVPEGEHVSFHEVLHLFACLTRRVTPDFTSGTGSL